MTIELFAGVFCAIGCSLLSYGTWSIWHGRRSRNWQTSTPGEIIISDLQRGVNRDGVTYRAEIVYKYAVAGKEYIANRVFFGDGLVSSFAKGAAREVVRYQIGKTVDVHYDPSNANLGVLEPGVNGLVYVILAMGFVFVSIGLLLATGVVTLSN